MQVVEPGRGPLELLLPAACSPQRPPPGVDVGAILVVTVAPEEAPARTVEGQSGVVDEARVDAQARAASATLTLQEVRTDGFGTDHVVGKFHCLIGRQRRWV